MATVPSSSQLGTPRAPPITLKEVQKSIEGLSDAEKIEKLAKRIVSAENEKSVNKHKADNFDKLLKAFQQLEKKAEKSDEILVKTEASKSKLEELCRELQKCNKELREENATRAKIIERERQKSVKNDEKPALQELRSSLAEIEKSMTEGRDRSDLLAADNRQLSSKLEELGKQYEEKLTHLTESYKKKEEYFEDLRKARDCEVDLLKTKLQQAQLLQQKALIEKEELTRSLVEGTRRVGEAIENEASLRAQVKQYSERYTELADSLAKSSGAFDKFKGEIERVNQQLKRVEMESTKWRIKYEEANKNILLLTVQKQEIDEKAAAYEKKVNKLESLCRALAQRNSDDAASSESQK